jgi:hypothetical protein
MSKLSSWALRILCFFVIGPKNDGLSKENEPRNKEISDVRGGFGLQEEQREIRRGFASVSLFVRTRRERQTTLDTPIYTRQSRHTMSLAVVCQQNPFHAFSWEGGRGRLECGGRQKCNASHSHAPDFTAFERPSHHQPPCKPRAHGDAKNNVPDREGRWQSQIEEAVRTYICSECVATQADRSPPSLFESDAQQPVVDVQAIDAACKCCQRPGTTLVFLSAKHDLQDLFP